MKAIIYLQSLGVKYEHVRSQILSGEAIPPLADVIARLIRVTDVSQTPCTVEEKAALAIESNLSSATFSSAGVAYSHKGHRASEGGKGQGNPPTCTYCGRRGHSQEKCYSLHGFPPKVTNVAQVQVSVDIDSSFASYRGTPTGLSSSVVISAEDYAQFTRLLQNQADSRTGGTIGMRREFQGLYRLSAPVTSEVPIACTAAASPEQIHSRLGHPSLANIKQMVPSLSKAFGVLVQFLQVKVIFIS
ncbi:hypothetical protein CRG98_042013 [Punica granatum]|uniref:GAG-pre-integrase domain-containing protein n=1 Tax=Punica granatum TaxID=22663 RepID=A0A2I0I0T3_PUNGR|nr:hypothetical protein CRG98_042013 [Punica granatum]